MKRTDTSKSLLIELLKSNNKLGVEICDKIKALAKKYKNRKDDIELDEDIPLKSRGSNVYAFYVYENWVYLLDDCGNDIDPRYVEVEFLEKFLATGVLPGQKKNSGEIYVTDGNGNVM
jgi:hypothetical protein